MLLDDLDFKTEKTTFHQVEKLFFLAGLGYCLFAIFIILFAKKIDFFLFDIVENIPLQKIGLMTGFIFILQGIIYRSSHKNWGILTPKTLALVHFWTSLAYTIIVIGYYIKFDLDIHDLISKGEQAYALNLVEDGTAFPLWGLIYLFTQFLFLVVIFVSAQSRRSI